MPVLGQGRVLRSKVREDIACVPLREVREEKLCVGQYLALGRGVSLVRRWRMPELPFAPQRSVGNPGDLPVAQRRRAGLDETADSGRGVAALDVVAHVGYRRHQRV